MYALVFACLSAPHALAQTAGTPGQPAYINCDRQSTGVRVFENPCAHASGQIACGEKVWVIDREGPWMKISTADGSEEYVSATQVSSKRERFAGVSLTSVKEFDPSSCFTPRVRSELPGKVPPHPIYTPDPEYDPGPRRAHVQGTVGLSITVGANGLVRDAKVQKSLDPKLDRKAIEAVQKWKFDPALEDGKPIAVEIKVDVSFRLYN